jgi:hypothetical protein
MLLIPGVAHLRDPPAPGRRPRAAHLGGRPQRPGRRANIVQPPPSSLAPTSRARTPVSAEADRRNHHQDRDQDQDRDRGAGDVVRMSPMHRRLVEGRHRPVLKSGANSWTLASGPLADAVSHSTSNMTDEDLAAIATCLKDSGAGALALSDLRYRFGPSSRIRPPRIGLMPTGLLRATVARIDVAVA